MKNFSICFLLFTVVSCTALFAMKFILWAMFKWGGDRSYRFSPDIYLHLCRELFYDH